MLRLAICLVLFGTLSAMGLPGTLVCSAATIYVPDNYLAIQDAINASAAGDTVIVRPGLYVEQVDFLGKKITVRSEMGPRLTTIDADSLFADSSVSDFHLTWGSPCLDAGSNITYPLDFEGDPRVVLGTVDFGADEYHTHLYETGEIRPGAPIEIKVVGIPGLPVLLGLGNGIQDPPQPTGHGALWLTLPLKKSWYLGRIPSKGILFFPGTVPFTWLPGESYPFQALVGPWGGSGTQLTNLMVLGVLPP